MDIRRYILILLMSFGVCYGQTPQHWLLVNRSAPIVYATWDPAAKPSTITLSNGNLTWKGNGSTAGVCHATVGIAVGSPIKRYFEYTIVAVGATNQYQFGFTLGNTFYATQTVLVNTSNAYQSVGYRSNTWCAGYNYGAGVVTSGANISSTSGTCGTMVNGAVFGFACDFTGATGTVSIYKNNTLAVTVSGIPTGTWYPTCVTHNGENTYNGTANFGATAFVYTPPSGYVGLY